MATLNPYLNFQGNAEEAFNFYKSVFGGEFATVMRFRDTPEAGKINNADLDKMMHIALPIGKHSVLMATDALESMGQKLVEGNNHHISISTESMEEAEHLFKGLSQDAKYIMVPFEKMFWGEYFGMFTDKFGTQWMVSYNDQMEAH
jgi:PhnB protein